MPLPSLTALVNILDATVYTLFGFVIPLYWTAKALLRQFIHTAPIASSASSALGALGAVESVVPEVDSIELTPIASMSGEKQEATVPMVQTGPTVSVTLPTALPVSLVNWLYYWSLLAILHLTTGTYERIVVPLLGSSLVYRIGKLGLVFWLGASSEDARPARLCWTALVGPLAAKYERPLDVLLQRLQTRGKIVSAHAITTLRQFIHDRQTKVKTI